MGWLDALGDMALTGSQLLGRNRAQSRQEALDKQDTDRQAKLLEIALTGEARAKESHLQGLAQNVLQNAGPNAVLDETGAATVRAGGLGSRLQQQEGTLASRQFMPAGENPLDVKVVESPGLMAGQRVIPNAAEQITLDMQAEARGDRAEERGDRTKQRQLRALVESPTFQSYDPQKRQQVWSMAGYPGQIPQSFEEQTKVMDYQHKLDMEKVRVQNPPDRYGPDRGFSGGTGPDKEWLKLYSSNMSKVAQLIQAQAYQANANGQAFDVENAMAQAQTIALGQTEAILGKRPSASVAPGAVQGPPSPPADPAGNLAAQIMGDRELFTLVKRNPANPQFIERARQLGVDPAAVIRRLRNSGNMAQERQPAVPASPGQTFDWTQK